MDPRDIIGLIFEAIGVIAVFTGLVLVLYSIFTGADWYATGTGGISSFFLSIPFFTIGGLMALFGYFFKRPSIISTQQTTQDMTMRAPTSTPPPSPTTKNVIICPNCGRENDAMSDFCGHCGKQISARKIEEMPIP